MKKILLTAAAFALAFSTSGAAADPVLFTPKTLSDAIPVDLNGDGKANQADWAPGQIKKTFGVDAKVMAPGQVKPKN